MTVLAATAWPTNAAMIADAYRLGYVHGRVCDVTYGLGRWWAEYRPPGLVAHDLRTDGVDFRHLPEPDDSYDTICLDGPYKLNGTPTPGIDGPYGVDVVDTRDGRMRLICEGIVEAARVLAPAGHLLIKCQDQVNGGQVRWQSRTFAEQAEACGLRHQDSLLMLAYRAQPHGTSQQHARRNYSTLLVMQAPR